jgi:hypothetical protein
MCGVPTTCMLICPLQFTCANARSTARALIGACHLLPLWIVRWRNGVTENDGFAMYECLPGHSSVEEGTQGQPPASLTEIGMTFFRFLTHPQEVRLCTSYCPRQTHPPLWNLTSSLWQPVATKRCLHRARATTWDHTSGGNRTLRKTPSSSSKKYNFQFSSDTFCTFCRLIYQTRDFFGRGKTVEVSLKTLS